MTDLFDKLSLLRYLVANLTENNIEELKIKTEEFIHEDLSYEFNYFGRSIKKEIMTLITDRNKAFAVDHL